MYRLEDLVYLMSRLRNPESGCPWDIKQDFQSLAKYTLEEAYEVVDAIETNDCHSLEEELGDLLFQVVFYSEIAREKQLFTIETVIDKLVAKLLVRHPHVFPSAKLYCDNEEESAIPEHEVQRQWEKLKAEERKQKGHVGVFDDIPVSMPALGRAVKLQKRMSQKGMDWQGVSPVFEKLEEEIAELRGAWLHEDRDGVEHELGDVIFTCVNLARKMNSEPEQALRKANQRFISRCLFIVNALEQENSSISEVSEARLDELWKTAKANLA
ncbi:MAG: nucleoside triphosphate pyrophosphohydrolase [Pseudomonadales bacterium]|nr:nucleoside triphosphate pyrophosphohydrolase [Pseudomonadales bacterium]